MTITTHQSFVLLLLCSGISLSHVFTIANTTSGSVPKPSEVEQQYPQLTQMDRFSNLLLPDLVAYTDDPKTECTIIAADNDAINTTMVMLGQYVGLFLQNATMQKQVLNYHVIPGRRVKAADMGTNVTAALTRANETLWFLRRNDLPYVSFGEKYVVPIQIGDILAGGCVMHIVSSLLVPPSLIPTFEDWQQKSGHPMQLASPQSEWRQPMPPVPGDVYTQANGSAASSAGSPATLAAPPAAVTPTTGAPTDVNVASTTAPSGGGGQGSTNGADAMQSGRLAGYLISMLAMLILGVY